MTATVTTPTPTDGVSAVSRRRQQRRREIIDAAWDLAAAEGLVGLSLRDLAAAVGMRAPSLYEYFGSKDDILDAMFALGWEDVDVLTTAVEQDASLRTVGEALVAQVTAFLDHFATNPVRYRLLLTRAVPGWEPGAEAMASSVRAYEHSVRALAGVGIDDPTDVALWTAVVAGLAAQQDANEPGGTRWRGLLPAAATMFLGHLGLDPDTPLPDRGDAPGAQESTR